MTSHEHDIGHITDYVQGTVRSVTVAGRSLAIVRNHDGFYAVRDTCPHQGAALSTGSVAGDVSHCPVGETQQYTREGEVLRCPWHGWQFDLSTGRSLVDPERTRVRSYPVRVEHERVLVALRQS
ncbi:MAG: Rieske (2Fe-2S) protein [Fuerstiella sp.]|nr:Rieske (2Fe-2S) protein [Fuerstiella sp.]